MDPQNVNIQLPTKVELKAKELEPVIAPGLRPYNHNEAFVTEPIELEVEELESVVAPGIKLGNHNETFLGIDPLATSL